jgi:hypothetical protein
MGNTYTEFDDRLREFVAAQRMFFVATAPLATEGHINLSPKGLDSFRILGKTTVAYLDLSGSGVETIAHLRENGRGRAIEPGETDWNNYRGEFPTYAGIRSVIVMDVERIADSCGYGVPRYEFSEQRTQLTDYAERKGEATLARYRREYNRQSIDGLPGLRGCGDESAPANA